MGEQNREAILQAPIAAGVRKQYGFSLFEFCMVAVVLSVVLVVFFDRVLMYQEIAEKAAAEVTVMNMRTGLRYRVAELLLHRQDRQVAGLIEAGTST
jgi:competence protein ComGC